MQKLTDNTLGVFYSATRL